jgi:ATP-dependent RNA helicase RhlE
LGPAKQRFGSAIASRIVRGPIVSRQGVVQSTESFAELGVSRKIVGHLSQHGITDPFAIQRAVIGDAIAGRDVIAKSPTGSGKTLAFGIPLVERIGAEDPRPAALVLAPTRSRYRSSTISAASAMPGRCASRRSTGAPAWSSRPRTRRPRTSWSRPPGRLEDLLARRAFKLDRVRMLVLDEADRMLDMGFRPAIDRLVAA